MQGELIANNHLLNSADEKTKAAIYPFDINSYDHYVIGFSGGKDSLCMLLQMLELGIPKHKIELWHHKVDGDSPVPLWDWPCTTSYCDVVAKHFGIPIYYSYRAGGYDTELNRKEGIAQGDYVFETPNGVQTKAFNVARSSGKGRGKFPALSANLAVRWCSAFLKVEVGRTALRNQERFIGKRVLYMTGERAQESSARAKRPNIEIETTNTLKRTVHQYRPIHHYSEKDVWALIKKYKVCAHPAYHVGFGRVSCAPCIFMSNNQAATIRKVLPKQFEYIAKQEQKLNFTMKHNMTIEQFTNTGTPFKGSTQYHWVVAAQSEKFTYKLIQDNWELPSGAFGDSAGPQ